LFPISNVFNFTVSFLLLSRGGCFGRGRNAGFLAPAG